MRKRRKAKSSFPVLFGIAAVLLLFCGISLLFLKDHTSCSRKKDRYKGSIEAFESSTDYNGNGIDDQSEVLSGALAYTRTQPKYKSKYYGSGYPDDEYGVCTDVTAQGCLAAGYDLMELIAADIRENPKAYGDDPGDEKIAFRRVRNQNVYFKNHAVVLTTDIYEIEKWQGGDIVVFKNHVGIVSDRRNKKGIPYVIHHAHPYQTAYEQDYLEKNKDNIIGHYRISE